MRKIISGRILCIDEEDRIISIKVKNQILFFYLQRSIVNRIGKYLEISRFIQFTIDEDRRLYRGRKVSNIDYILKIMEIRQRKNIIYYDIMNIKEGSKDLINSLGTRMFLDLEMSMHPYRQDKNFKQEIIQVGYYLVDNNNEMIEEYSEIIKPTVHKMLTKRTLKFLEISQADVDNGLKYEDFYVHFKQVVEKYSPAIIVWGKNDFLALRESYKINRFPSLKRKTRYINLLKMHKNYFNLKNDLGLFNALKLYTEPNGEQMHNALEDAFATYQIFNGFKEVLNHKMSIDLSAYK
jgi:sporulation inhibitor KapD